MSLKDVFWIFSGEHSVSIDTVIITFLQSSGSVIFQVEH